MTNQKLIPAHDGFFVCIPIESHPITEFYREPIIAWKIDQTDNPFFAPDAVTITGVVDDPIIQNPDGSYQAPYDAIFRDESGILQYMNEMRHF